MTKTKFYLQFFFVAAFFVLPPLFAPFLSGGENAVEFAGFSWWNASCLLLAALLNFFLGEFQGEVFRGSFFSKGENFGNEISISDEKAESSAGAAARPNFFEFFSKGIFFVFSKGSGKFRRVIAFAEFLKTFGLLCATQAFFELLGFLLKVRHVAKISFPCDISMAQLLSFAAALFSAAFYEETLYRAYLPFSLKRIFLKKWLAQNEISNAENGDAAQMDFTQTGRRGRFFDTVLELAVIAIFGFSHLRNGVLATANATVAGFFLRRCAVKTGGIKAGFFAHFLYNAISLAITMAVCFAKR